MNEQTIYEYIRSQESSFETEEVKVGDNWNWSFRNHVQLIFHLKNGVFFTGANDWMRAFKNIMEPVLNLSFWTEDLEVKDVVFHILGEEGRAKSFLIKKYHDEVFAKKYNLDSLFDEITESDLTYGGVLVQKTDNPLPEVLKLKRIAFCDQTNVLGGALGFKYNFSPSALKKMSASGWGDEKNGATISIEDLIDLAGDTKTPAGMVGKSNKVPTKSIEVYIVRGDMPEDFLYDDGELEQYCEQLHVVAFYTGKDDKKTGVTLYRKDADPEDLKFFTSQEVEDRGLGRGVGESLLHPQIWTNYLTIHKTNMLGAASKIPLYTDDPAYTERNKIQDMENLEITVVSSESKHGIKQVPTVAPANLQVMEAAIVEWHEQAQYAGAAFDPQMGKESPSGTTFRGQNQVIQQGRGIHDRRRGQRAKFIEEIYRDWIIPYIKREIVKGQKFLSSISLDDLEWITQQLVVNHTNRMVKEKILSGEAVLPDEVAAYQKQLVTQMQSKGNRHTLEILKDEMKEVDLEIGIDIAGKQKDLVGMVDNLTSVFKTILANPYILKAPPIQKLFNKIIEASGLDPIDLSGLDIPPMPARRLTESVDYKDLVTPPNEAQQKMLSLAGIDVQPTQMQPTQQLAQ